MPNINLLPWREERREELRKEFLVTLGVVALAGALILALVWWAMNAAIDYQRDRNQFIQTHINELDKQVKEISTLKKKRQQMLDRMRVIQDLQGNRPVIVRVFDELARVMPDGVYFNEVKRTGNTLEIRGTAESANRVSSLMRNLDKSEWFKSPNLTQIKADPSFGEQANDFTMSVQLQLPGSDQDDNGTATGKQGRRGKRGR